MKIFKITGGLFLQILATCLIGSGLFCFITPILAVEPGELLISEVQITGGTGLTKNDYIKIYNLTDADIDLDGYLLVKRTKTGTSDSIVKLWTSEVIVPSHGFHLWANSTGGFADNITADSATDSYISNNNGIAIRFGSANTGTIIDSLGWGTCENIFVENSVFPTNPAENEVLKRTNNIDTNNNSVDFTIQTPGQEDIIEEVTEENTDTEEDDNTEEIFVIINNSYNSPPPTIEEEEETEEEVVIQEEPEEEVKNYTIIITEMLPNPIGIDNPSNCSHCGEFVELYNYGEENVNLVNWKIEINNDSVYTFNHYTILKPKKRLILYKDQTKLILKNQSGTVKLYNPDELQQTIKYDQADEGYSYALLEGSFNREMKWVWNKNMSPGESNYWLIPKNNRPIIEIDYKDTIKIGETIHFDTSDSYDPDNNQLSFAWDFGNGKIINDKNPQYTFLKAGAINIKLTVDDGSDKVIKQLKIKVTGESKEEVQNKITANVVYQNKIIANISNNTGYISVGSIEKIKSFSKGSKLSIVGIVSVPQNIFSTQYLYIADNSSGLQIYSYNKDFPELYIGDEIQINGELSFINDEPRLKTNSQADITLLNQKHPQESLRINTTELNDSLLYRLVTVNGEITHKSGNTIYLDDGLDDVVIHIKEQTGLKNSDFTIGDNTKITGLVKKISNEIRILPRGINDLEIVNKSNEKVLGVKTDAEDKNIQEEDAELPLSNIKIEPRNKNIEIYQYTIIFAFGIITALIIWIIRLRKEI